MNMLSTFFENSQMSLAAYALSLRSTMSTDEYKGALVDAGMSPSQAAKFVDTYAIVDQSPADPYGFSATLFADRLDPARKILAIRGVDNAFDFLRHVVDIGLLGTSDLVLEYRSLNNYYQQLITQGLLGAGETFAVTGHSLGGFLAQLFTLDHANVVSHADTYNAPGIGGVVAEVLGAFDITQTSIPGSLITNVFAQTGPEFVAGAGTLLGSAQPVFIENQGLLAIPGNHGIVPLTDSLAVYSLFARLAPAVSVDTVTNILKAGWHTRNTAAIADKSLEVTLDALRILFQENFAFGTPDTNAAPTTVDNRDGFYTNLFSLQSYIEGLPFYNSNTKSLGLSVDSLIGQGATSLFNTAQTDIATRYALYKLNPFVIRNADDLYNAINNNSGALDVYNPTTNTGALSDQYLKDRSAFLANKVLSGMEDKIAQSGDPLAIRNGSPLYFEDRGRTSTYGLYQGGNNAVSEIPFEEIAQVVFGHSGTDLIGGGDQADRLYGMAGDDTLQGKLGNDYLEGGQGTDTYIYTSNDGLDTILDTDGLGKITFDGTILNGGNLLIGETYQSADRNYFYTLLHNTGEQDSLLINAKGGTILVKDFQEEILLREAA